MTWSAATSNGFESAKIAHLVVAYAQGKGLDIGCGTQKCWPEMIGVDSLKDYGGQRPPAVDIVSNGEKLDVFADKTFDYIFSSHFLEHVTDYQACLKEWWRTLKVGAHLILYLPHAEYYPKIGQEGSNPDHKHDYTPNDIIEAMKKIGSWELLENEERNKTNEYSFFQVFRKLEDRKKPIHKFNVWQRNPQEKKRCLVIRYGAIGDMILMASVLPELKKQGYHVTVNTAPNGYEILKHDPHIDEWIVQAKDYVPNQELGPYWQQLKFEGRYDKIINLCESIEGGLLTLPGRLQHDYPDDSRRKLFSTVNYMERTHDIAQVPYEFSSKFYPTIAEINWAKKERAKIDVPVIAWAITGSAQHKIYPWTQIVVAWLLENTSAHIFLMGDSGVSKQLQDGIIATLEKDSIDHKKRVHQMCGVWPIRDALSFIQQVDCVVGPETGLLNAVCMEKNSKVIYLSHSSHENLTRHWKNTTVLLPDTGKCACWPCNRLHYSLDYCPQDEKTQSALCASSIAPKRVFEALMKALNYKKVVRTYEQEPDPTPPAGGTNVVGKVAA